MDPYKTNAIAIYLNYEGKEYMKIIPTPEGEIVEMLAEAINTACAKGATIDGIAPATQEAIDSRIASGKIDRAQRDSLITHDVNDPRRVAFCTSDGETHRCTIATKELIQATRQAFEVHGRWTVRKPSLAQIKKAKQRRILSPRSNPVKA